MTANANTVVITGASSGLGEALALEYARDGATLGLIARDVRRLEDVTARCIKNGARCEFASIDVRDGDALRRWMSGFDARHAIDLLFVNAGVFAGCGPSGQMETVEEIVWQIRTNLEGAALTIAAALPGMRTRRAGRIVLIGSLAALQPLADAPSYSATKAGLIGYGEALREYLAPEGVSVSLVCPGYIKTAQTAHHVGALPLQMPPARAATIIRSNIARGRSFIVFPRRLHLLILVGRLIHWRLRAFFNRGFRFHIEKPPEQSASQMIFVDSSSDKVGKAAS